MAGRGLKKAKYNSIDNSTKKYKTLTDSKVSVLEQIIESKFAPEYNSAELYADDILTESDYSFKKGTLSLVVGNDKDSICAELLGNNISEDNEVTSNINDTAPEFGFGHIVPKIVNGEKAYKVEFFPRIKFTKITSDRKTKGESTEFATTNIEATVFPLSESINGLKEGDWEKHKTFKTETEAESYLDNLLTPVTEQQKNKQSNT